MMLDLADSLRQPGEALRCNETQLRRGAVGLHDEEDLTAPAPLAPCTFGFFPNSHSLFLVLLMGCFGSDRGPGAPSLSRSPLGVLLMVPSEPVLLRF